MRTILYSLFFGIIISMQAGHPPRAEERPKIKIGVSTPLTGDASTFGLDVKDILTFANETLANNRYEFIFEDDRCAAKEGLSAANKFISFHHTKYVIGLPCSMPILAAAPLYEKNKIITVATWASSPKIASAGDYIFRTTPSDKKAAELLLSHIQKKHKNVFIISAVNDYAQDFKDAFIAANNDHNFSIKTEDYIPKSGDFRTNLMKIKNTQPEAIFLNTEDEVSFGIFVKNIAELGWTIPIYGAYWPSSEALIKSSAKYLKGIEYVDTPSLSTLLNDEGKRIYEQYQKRFGKLRSSEASFAPTFEGFRALHHAIESGKDPREFLYHTTFQGIFGSYTFDSDGECQGISFVMKRVPN